MDQEFESLRREVARRERGRGRRYPQSLRDRVVDWASERRRRGAGWLDLAEEIGIAAESLRRWTSRELPPTAMVPVEVVPGIGASHAGRPLRVVTRAGHSIEGLTLVEAIEVVRRLG